MTQTKIHYLFSIESGKLLLVYYTTRNCYQFRVVTATSQVMGNQEISYTPEAASTEERRWLGVSGANGTRKKRSRERSEKRCTLMVKRLRSTSVIMESIFLF